MGVIRLWRGTHGETFRDAFQESFAKGDLLIACPPTKLDLTSVLAQLPEGEIQQVGFSLYTEMLKRAVKDLQAGKEPDLSQPLEVVSEINLHTPALLPTDYCPDVQERLTLYKRLANCDTEDDLRALQEELIDRFGELPPQTVALIETHRLRMLVKSPLFTTIVVVTLALGIGLNTAVYAAVDALLLRPVPGVARTHELVQLYRTWPGDEPWGSNSIPHYQDIRRRTPEVFSGVAAWSWENVSITADGRPSLVFAQMASANLFDVLGVQAAMGREQLRRLPAMVARRRELVDRYRELLADIPGLGLPAEPEWARSNWQSYCVRLPKAADQRRVMQTMLDHGIATRRGVMNIHLEGAYLRRRSYVKGSSLGRSVAAQLVT